MNDRREPLLIENPEYLRELMEIVNTSPFPSHMSMRLTAIAMDRATITLNTGECHLQPFGIVHGGVLSTLIDTATFWSAFMRVPENAGLVNIDLKLNYLRPVESGVLIAEGLALRSGKTISYAESKVFNDKRELVAHGTSTLMSLPGKGLKLNVCKFIDA